MNLGFSPVNEAKAQERTCYGPDRLKATALRLLYKVSDPAQARMRYAAEKITIRGAAVT